MQLDLKASLIIITNRQVLTLITVCIMGKVRLLGCVTEMMSISGYQ